jgi:hypothetical protein
LIFEPIDIKEPVKTCEIKEVSLSENDTYGMTLKLEIDFSYQNFRQFEGALSDRLESKRVSIAGQSQEEIDARQG